MSQRRGSSRTAAALLAAVAGFLLLAAPRPAGALAAACNVENGLGSFSSTNQPGACWRPYSDSSPFNRPLSQGAPLAPNSSQMVGNLISHGDVPEQFVSGDPQRDGGVPIYWSKPSDPVYTLHCVKPWSHCALEGLQIHIPAGAQPTGGYATPGNDHDAHMTVIDQASRWEYDMWNVQSTTGSTLNFGWGGKTRIDGDGLGSAAVAADYASIAGPIRPEELVAGQIDHALTMVVPCTDTYVYPANSTGLNCADGGLPASDSIPMGSHFELKMSARAIKRLRVAGWQKTVLRALATYGAYASDTSGNPGDWGFERESSASWTSFGQPDPWVQYAKSLGIQPADFNHNGYQEYWMNLGQGVPWGRMAIVSTCAAQGLCPVLDRSPRLRRVRARVCRRGLARWNRRRSHSNARTHRRRVRWSHRCRRLARPA